MINTVCNCEVDDFTLLPFWRRMYIVIFMGPDKQEEKSEKALKQESFTYQTTKLEFEPFKMNFHSTVNPLRQRVILALEAWNKEGIAELLDNCCKIEGLYVEHHIEDLSFFRLAAWTTNCDLIPKLIDWNIAIIEENQQTLNLDWKQNTYSSTVLIHIEKLFDYCDEDSGSENSREALTEYEKNHP